MAAKPRNSLTSSVVRYEVLCGPVGLEEVELVRAVLMDRVIPFTADQAIEADRLLSACGRQRRHRVDAMLASAAIVTNAALATDNADDFRMFAGFGLLPS